LAAALNLPLPLARLLIQRGHVTEDAARRFLRPSLGELSDPQALAGMAAAVEAVVAVADDPPSELPAAAEELARDVTLFGTYDEAGAAIGAWFDAGADVVDLVLPPGRPEEELFELVAVAGRVAGASA